MSSLRYGDASAYGHQGGSSTKRLCYGHAANYPESTELLFAGQATINCDSGDQERGVTPCLTPKFICKNTQRDTVLARVFATATCLSVRLAVRLSVTSRYCVKMTKASVMISSPSGSPTMLDFLAPNFITKFYGVHPSDTIRCDTIEEINVDSKAEYTA